MGWFAARLRPLWKKFDGELKVLAKNSSWVFAANAFRTLLAFVKSVVIARGLGVDLYGTFVLVFAFVSTIQEFFNLNLGTAVIKFGADYRSQGRLDKLVALLKVSGVASGALAVLSVGAVAAVSGFAYDTFIEVPGLGPYIVLYAVVAAVSLFDSVSAGLLRLFYRFRLNSIVQMTTGLIDVAFVTVVLFFFPRQLEPFLLAMIAAKLLDSAVINGTAFWEMRGELKGNGRAPLGIIREDGKTIRWFILNNSGSRTLKTLMDRGDVLLLGAFASSQQVGLYDIAKKLAQVVLRFTDPLVSSIFPQVAKLIAERRLGEVRSMLTKLTSGIGLAVVPVFVVAYFASDTLLLMLYGAEYVPAANVFVVHLISVLVAAAVFWGLPLVQSLDLVAQRFRVTAVGLLFGGTLGYFVAPAYGAVGVAVVLLLTKVFITVDMLYAANKKMRVMEAAI